MTTDQKNPPAKVGLLELAKQLGNVSQACQVMGYSRDSSIASRNCMRLAGRRLYIRSAAAVRTA